MKIGLLSTSFPREPGDAAGSFVLGFAEALAARGHRLEVLAPEPHEARFTTPPRFASVDVRWVRYLAPRHLQRTFYGAGVLDNLRREPLAAVGALPFTIALTRATAQAQRDWDALVSHWALPCALIAGELAHGRPHLAVLHSADVFLLERLPGEALRRQLATRIAARAQALLFSSRDLRRRFLALIEPVRRGDVATRAHVCAMGIAPQRAPAGPREQLRERLGLRGFTLLSLGRLIPLKGLTHAIDALAHLPASVRLVIVGDGPARAELARHAARWGERVRFLGARHGEEKSALLHAADAFVLPSIRLADGRTEGMPTALLEAMEHGLPVVASDVGGVSDVVRSGHNGWLVPPAAPSAIARAVHTLLDAETCARLARGARETASLYHWSELGPRLEALLQADLT